MYVASFYFFFHVILTLSFSLRLFFAYPLIKCPVLFCWVSYDMQAAASLRRSATLCRESLRDSVTLLRKIERIAAQVSGQSTLGIIRNSCNCSNTSNRSSVPIDHDLDL